MNEKTEAAISIIAALFVLLSALWDPRVSAGVAVIFLVVLAIYKLVRKT